MPQNISTQSGLDVWNFIDFGNISCYYKILATVTGSAIFNCDQAALWMVQSVRLSVLLSVRPSIRPSVRPSVCPSVPHLFVELEELHIPTARKPIIHQNQPVAQYLHKNVPCILQFMPVGLHHSAWSLQLSIGIEVIGKFHFPSDGTNAFGNHSPCTRCRLFHIALFYDNIHGGK